MAGYRPNVVKEWAGHADVKTTLKFYSQVDESDVRRAVTHPFLPKNDTTLDTTTPIPRSGTDDKCL